MKKLILAAAIIFTANLVSAQKMATVNSQEILLTMPEVKSMQAKLQSKNDELSKQLESMYKTYESKVAELKKSDASLSGAMKEVKIQEVQELEGRIQKFQQAAQSEVQELEKTLTAPLVEKAKKAIQEVAKELMYTHVFDVVTGSLLVWPDTNDITSKVKIKLGIDPNAKPVAPAGAQGSAPAGK